MAGKAVVEIKGLKEFRRDLKAVDPELPKQMRKLQKELADDARDMAQGIASGMGGEAAGATGTIRSYATQLSASVGVASGTRGSSAYWGTKKHTGWYAAGRYRHSVRQHPVWVGAGWEPGVAGQGPYAINDALARIWPTAAIRYNKMLDTLMSRAYPD